MYQMDLEISLKLKWNSSSFSYTEL